MRAKTPTKSHRDSGTGRPMGANGSESRKTVLVADDHPVIRMGVSALLDSEPEFQVIAQVSSCTECCERAAAACPDIVILDLEMGDCRATQTLQNVLETCPDTAVVVYTGHISDHLVRSVVKTGARGFVTKGAATTRLMDALRAVARGEVYLDPSVTEAIVGPRGGGHRIEALTEREQSVLSLLAQGKRNKEISRSLYISERTVKFHVSALMQKLGASNRTEAVKTAIDEGLIEP